jgi:D-alanyl-D-alanine carboxypeptidase
MFSFVFILLWSNSRAKKMNQFEIIAIALGRIKTIEKPIFNARKDLVIGKFDYNSDSTFIKIDPPYCAKELYLNTLVKPSNLKVYNATRVDGIALKIICGTRNFEEQKIIWEQNRKFMSLVNHSILL